MIGGVNCETKKPGCASAPQVREIKWCFESSFWRCSLWSCFFPFWKNLHIIHTRGQLIQKANSGSCLRQAVGRGAHLCPSACFLCLGWNTEEGELWRGGECWARIWESKGQRLAHHHQVKGARQSRRSWVSLTWSIYSVLHLPGETPFYDWIQILQLMQACHHTWQSLFSHITSGRWTWPQDPSSPACHFPQWPTCCLWEEQGILSFPFWKNSHIIHTQGPFSPATDIHSQTAVESRGSAWPSWLVATDKACPLPF